MSQTWPIILNLFAAIFGSFGQYCYKIGSQKLKLVPLYQNWQLLLGMILFSLVMVLFVWSFKIGGRISVTFPVYATTFLWGTILGVWLDKEPFNLIQGLGVLLVIGGVSLIAVFSYHN